jgi:hypothetical protein
MTGLALAGAASPANAQTQSPPAEARSVQAGVYTAEQALEGAALFEQYCLRCHSAEEYRSARFREKWSSRTLRDLYAVIASTMPFDQPASLPLREYSELVAFILELNGFPAGDVLLEWDEKALAAITIDPPP